MARLNWDRLSGRYSEPTDARRYRAMADGE